MNIITVAFDALGKSTVALTKNIQQGDNLTNQLQVSFYSGHPAMSTLRLHAELPDGTKTPYAIFLEKQLTADIWQFDLSSYFTTYAGTLTLNLAAQFTGVVENYETVITDTDIEALYLNATRNVDYAYVALDTMYVYSWDGSAFVLEPTLTYQIPKEFQRNFKLNIEPSVVSTGDNQLVPEEEEIIISLINNVGARVNVLEDYFTDELLDVLHGGNGTGVIDDTPTTGSENLVKSGGVHSMQADLIEALTTGGLVVDEADKADKATKDGSGNVITTTYATKTENGLKADKVTTYTKDETDDLLDAKADQATTYTKTESDTLLLAKADKTDTYTKTEVNNLVSSLYKYKGSVADYAHLPSTGQVTGDVWNVIDSGINYAWTGSAWDDIGGVEALATALNNGLMSKEDFTKLSDLYTKANLDIELAKKVESTDTSFVDGKIMVQDGAVAKKVKQSARSLSEYYLKTEDDVLLLAKADKLYTINLLSNGHPTASTTGYTAVNSTLGFGASGLTSLATAQNGGFTRAITTVVGRIYHFHAKITAPIGTTITFGTTTLTTTVATIQLLSGSFTATATSTNLVLADVRASGWTTIYFDYGVIIDKTALLVAGNEWTVERMDKYMAYKYANSWIDNVNTEFKSQADDIYWNAMAIKATNLVTNGSFTSTTSWSKSSESNVSFTVASNIGTITRLNTTGNIFLSQSISIPANHKIYVKAILGAYTTDGVWVGKDATNTDRQALTSGAVIFTPTTTTTSVWFGSINTNSVGASFTMSYVIMIDLTSTYGAGKEPTVAQMNAKMAYFTNSWFDATTNLENVMTLSETKADKAQETRITPTLTNATTTYLTYRKDNFGYVDTAGVLVVATLGTNYTYPSGYRSLTTLYVPMVKSDGTFAYAIVNTNGTFVTNATGTFYINFRFATV